jgi:hypothetical protein
MEDIITPSSTVTTTTLDVISLDVKRTVPFPSPLPQLRSLVNNYNEKNIFSFSLFRLELTNILNNLDTLIKYVNLITRELVEYFIKNNYDLNDRTAGRKICQTVLERYPVLNNRIADIFAFQSRIRNKNKNGNYQEF